MSAQIVIHDGTPWWNSPDIWVVPGNDPSGPAGSPIAGTAAYVWARVTNNGNVAAPNTRIDFYWANPSAAMVVGVATAIGSAYADLDPGQTQEVLCLVPWVPVIVNGGHECLVAVAHGPGDTNPIPDPLPNGYTFNPPAHEQIAQLNLSVLLAAKLVLPQVLHVQAGPREAVRARLVLGFGKALEPKVLSNLGLSPQLRMADGRKVDASLSLEARCGACGQGKDAHQVEVEAARGTSVPVFLNLRANELGHDEYQLVHVVEHRGDTIVGGVSFVIINPKPQE